MDGFVISKFLEGGSEEIIYNSDNFPYSTICSSVRFSPLYDIDTNDNSIIYTVFSGGVRHDSDQEYYRIMEFKYVDNSIEIINNVLYTESQKLGWYGSGCVIFPSLTNRNVCCVVTSSRNTMSGNNIHILQLHDNSIINYNYITHIKTGEQITVKGDWCNNTIYISYVIDNSVDEMYKITADFSSNVLVGIQGESVNNQANRSYTNEYYMENGNLYTITDELKGSYSEITGNVKLFTIDNTYIRVLVLQNNGLYSFNIDLNTFELISSGDKLYSTDVTTWDVTSSSAKIADKCRLTLDVNTNGTIYMILSPNPVNYITRLSTNYYDSSITDVTSSDIIKNKVAIGKQGRIVGTLENLDTSDATATAEDITINKTAYINGQKVTGNLPLFPNSRTFTVDGGVTNDVENNRIQISTINSTKQILDTNLNMEFNSSYSDVAEAIGLTADKIKSGETILGITGTYTGGTE